MKEWLDDGGRAKLVIGKGADDYHTLQVQYLLINQWYPGDHFDVPTAALVHFFGAESVRRLEEESK